MQYGRRLGGTEPLRHWWIATALGLDLDSGLRGLSALCALPALGAAGGGLVAVEPS